jgi:hypothetical protein
MYIYHVKKLISQLVDGHGGQKDRRQHGLRGNDTGCRTRRDRCRTGPVGGGRRRLWFVNDRARGVRKGHAILAHNLVRRLTPHRNILICDATEST